MLPTAAYPPTGLGPSPRCWPLGATGPILRVPVVQANLGACGGWQLAAAVSRAGAMGCLTVHAPDALRLGRDLARIRRVTHRPVLLAFTAEWESDVVLQTCLARGFRCFQVFWWNGPRLASRIRAAGGRVFWQVGGVEQARDALAAGATALIAQGTEAGGQVRSALPLADFIPAVAPLTREAGAALIAGGGLADRRDVARVLSLGADAALLGTRFLLSNEADAPLAAKVRLAASDPTDLFLDTSIAGDWPCAPRRRLSLPRAPDRPDLYAGLGLSRIGNILPAAQIVRRLVS